MSNPRKQITLTIDPELHKKVQEKLKSFDRTHTTLSALMDFLLRKYLAEVFK